MIRYLLLCLACLAGYFLPLILDIPSEGDMFFVELSSWSFAIMIAALLINYGKTSELVAAVEILAITLNLVCLHLYHNGKGFIYASYGHIVDVLTIAEGLILIAGAPRDALRRAGCKLWTAASHWWAAAYRAVLSPQKVKKQ